MFGRVMLESSALETACASIPATEPLWAEAPLRLPLTAPEVHIFATRLDWGASFRSLLSRDEKERANRFLFDLHRNRFIAGRAFLRTVLGRYLDFNPAKLRFSYSPEGKPALDEPFKHSDIRFNLAHSEDLALVAVSRAGEIGVDVEHIRPIPEADELVARFFSNRESYLFDRLPDDLKPGAFFNLWTRKEAWLKATGEGIAHSLRLVEVSFLPHEPARLLSLPGSGQQTGRWTLRELHPAPGFTAAIAVASFPIRVRTFSWPTQAEL